MWQKIALCLLWGTTLSANAVYLSQDGIGQALIFPYYTTQSVSNSAYNTLFSIVNHTADAKAIRVRFREGRNSREVAQLNVFLSPRDVWTAGIVPDTTGARLITHDSSCTSPQLTLQSDGARSVAFSSAAFVGDGNGDDLARIREGWFEVIEMATVSGQSAAAISHSNGTPANCAAVQGDTVGVSAPSGGLSGTLTLVNVATGLDFSMNAEALSALGTRPFYRPGTDSYPNFNAAEIDPVSIVATNGSVYRSVWNRPVDAISAVLMRASWAGEYVLDASTRSRSDFVATFPTKSFYVGNTTQAPFSASCQTPGGTFAGEPATFFVFDREERGGALITSTQPTVSNFRCSAVGVFDFQNSSAHTASGPTTQVLGSANRALTFGAMPVPGNVAADGWAMVQPTFNAPLRSQAESTRTDVATGAVSVGPHAFSGLPVVGFTVRTFENGVLSCGNALCQGNFGGAFALKYTRSIGG